jgi:hypothetical protein
VVVVEEGSRVCFGVEFCFTLLLGATTDCPDCEKSGMLDVKIRYVGGPTIMFKNAKMTTRQRPKDKEIEK